MSDVSHPAQPQSAAASPEQSVFQTQWRVYRKMIDENYLYHREVYAALGEVLARQAPQPFRFLDIACGDGSATVTALRGKDVSAYCGIDLSRAALDMAGETLGELGCPVELVEGDFRDVLESRREFADVVWIGLSLHHLLTPGKLELMRAVRLRLAERGLFLIYEVTRPDGEDRDGWLRRWERQKSSWTAYSEEEWETMWRHVSSADYPETSSQWHLLGHEAGFTEVREIFVAPSDLLRMYCFS